MQKLKNKLYALDLKVRMGLYNLMNNEDGDTNFISIAIVLVIVLAIAVLFIGFRDDITEAVSGAWSDMMSALSGNGNNGP